MKNYFSLSIRFVIFSNIFIAVCASAYTVKSSLLLYGNYGNLHVAILVFSATLLFYCFHRINKKKFISSDEGLAERNSWMSTHKNVYYFLIAFSVLSGGIQLFYLPIRTWLVFIPVGLLGIGYTFPIIPAGSGMKRLRDISWLKPLWIALAFSLLTTFLPVLDSEPLSEAFKTPVLFIFLRGILFIFAICIPFDIRDMQFDELKGVNTLPVITGAKTSVYVAILLLLVFISLVCTQFLYFQLNFKSAMALFVSAILTIISMPLAKPGRPALLYPLLYDGAMLVQCALIIGFWHF